MDRPITIYGGGSWGTTLAVLLARSGTPVTLWARDPEQGAQMAALRENVKYLPGIRFPDLIRVVHEATPPACPGGEAVVSVPSHAVRGFVASMSGPAPAVWVIASKGLEEGTCLRMTEVVAQSSREPLPAVVLAGPSLAREVSAGKPTALLAASDDDAEARRIQKRFASERFRVYRSSDPVGVELATSLKNVVALAAGIAAGLDLGANALGALVTRGLAEITRLGLALGARMETFLGLAGVGDLVTTCSSPLSRNHALGEALGRGQRLEDALRSMTMVAEGVRTAHAAVHLAERVGVEVPIASQVHRILAEGLDARTALDELMTRPLRSE
ncbi:MAG: NAD(P)-dependent glycerol-3-phosphate dehydrogenase [Candidatus Eisenbacteria bacterium]|uniref:Glycerol-3-phosphate dehydrogenase [NAD(P)+] n=1 Tax=Eiseniibacteriota bacterium TaxID=2212470 RepID=A0A956M4N1_UNCEI|nr:NAD(P)-dependent glycerol-3-phosphate dehydrogenase [Candidatus Eisenbacteria bacterium]